MSSWLSGQTCQPDPWSYMRPPPAEFDTQLPSVAAISGLTEKGRSLGGIGEVLQVYP